MDDFCPPLHNGLRSARGSETLPGAITAQLRKTRMQDRVLALLEAALAVGEKCEIEDRCEDRCLDVHICYVLSEPMLDFIDTPAARFDGDNQLNDLAGSATQLHPIAPEEFTGDRCCGPLVPADPRVIPDQSVTECSGLPKQVCAFVCCGLFGPRKCRLDEVAVKDAVLHLSQEAHKQNVDYHGFGVREVLCFFSRQAASSRRMRL